ncbi:RSP_2648 family PIN domain-containing protein [Roseobacter weihaiensis]|uniref:RSP_2648 family PIN domain-containing protein n=1 Tax=Roseobacter weihaiensis TaxID=2763262 RepID=UPI001D0B013F|nr:PIN domain-containing protein [Roseobacter sp. H9]
MRILIDTCVLYPTVMRQMVLGAARQNAFTPLWSGRILEEWARAACKLGPTGEAQARAEIALTEAAFPAARVKVPEGLVAALWLPDDNDIHVLAAAVSASAEAIMTLNAKDFPRGTLAEQGLTRIDPDGYLYDLWLKTPVLMEAVGAEVLAEAQRLSGAPWQMRALLKKARLPRLAKALG